MNRFAIGRYSYHPFNINDPQHRAFYQRLISEQEEDESELLNRLGDISYMFETPYQELDAFEINSPTTYLVSDHNLYVAFIYLSVRNRILSITLGVRKEERGKHYSTNINQDITDYILDNFDIDYIEICIDEDNIGSIKAVTNAGFTKEEGSDVYYIKRKRNGIRK